MADAGGRYRPMADNGGECVGHDASSAAIRTTHRCKRTPVHVAPSAGEPQAEEPRVVAAVAPVHARASIAPTRHTPGRTALLVHPAVGTSRPRCRQGVQRQADPDSMHGHRPSNGSDRKRHSAQKPHMSRECPNPGIGAAPARGEGGGRGVQLRGVELNRVVGSGGVETDASHCRPVIASSSPTPAPRVTSLFVERIGRDPFGCI